MASPVTRILVPTDFSTASLTAAQFAARLAVPLGASLAVLHVLAHPNEMIGLVPGASVEEELELQRTTAHDLMSGVVAAMNSVGAMAIDCFVDVASSRIHAVAARAKTGAFDLIVMATHGRSAIGRVMLGSVAAGVLREAPCPILMIRP